jgi:hypothetical protein
MGERVVPRARVRATGPLDERVAGKAPGREVGGVTSMRGLLHWTFAVQKADRAMEWASKASPEDYLGAASADGAWAVARQAALGARVDCIGSPGLDKGALHPDAELVYLLGRRRLSWKLFARVAHHARTDSLPDWGQGIAPLRAAPNMVWRRSGALHWLEPEVRTAGVGPRNRIVKRWCPVVWKDERAAIAAARAYYAEWHEALADWAAACAGRLSYWHVAGLGAHETPWAAAGDPAKSLDTNPNA